MPAPAFDYTWLSVPGNQLFTSLDKGEELDTRLSILEANTLTGTGTVGPTGPQGPTGAQGIQGEQGPVGPAGAVGPAGEDGVQGPQGIQGEPGQDAVATITPRGAYSSTSVYNKDDCVVASGASYICAVTGTTGVNPVTDTTGKWFLFVLQGPQGEQGIQGIQGVQGPVGPVGPAGPQGVQGIQGPAGKDAPTASITAASLSPALQQQLATSAALANGSSCGSWGEIDTGRSFRGAKVYRQDFTLYVNAAANIVADMTLIPTANYVDTILSQGGMWAIGYQTERHAIPGSIDGTNSSHCLLFGANNVLTWRSKANNTRSGAPAVIIVEYTKK